MSAFNRIKKGLLLGSTVIAALSMSSLATAAEYEPGEDNLPESMVLDCVTFQKNSYLTPIRGFQAVVSRR